MAYSGLHIEAELTLSLNHDHFLLVADGNYLIVNFTDLKQLERVMKHAGEISFPGPKPAKPAPKKKSGGNPLQKLNDVNAMVRELQLVIDVRVGRKTYVTLGAGKTAKITAAAVFGKIGSFFGL